MAKIKPPLPVIQRGHPLAKGLVAMYPFFERGGLTLNDISGRNNKGTLTNMDPSTDWVKTPYGYGLDFDGSDDYVAINKSLSLNISSQISIALWINFKGFSDYTCPLTKGDWNFAYGLIIGVPGLLNVYFKNLTTPQLALKTAMVINEYYHFVATYNGSTVILYLNGKLDNSASSTGTIATNNEPVWIGREQSAGGRWTINGIIADVRIWNRALTTKEITQLYADPWGIYRTKRYIPVSFVGKSGLGAALTGTITTATEVDIVDGDKTIILTLTGDTWIAAGAESFDLQRQNIIDGLVSAQSETFGWNNVVLTFQSVNGVVRTSDTVVTITLDAEATYDITATETITATIPGTALTLGGQIVATPTFDITSTIIGGVTTGFLSTNKGYW